MPPRNPVGHVPPGGSTRADKQLSSCHTLAHVCGWAGRLWLFVLPVSDIGPGRLRRLQSVVYHWVVVVALGNELRTASIKN